MSLIADALRKQRKEETSQKDGGSSRMPAAPLPIVPPRRRSRGIMPWLALLLILGAGGTLVLLVGGRDGADSAKPTRAETEAVAGVGSPAGQPRDVAGGESAVDGLSGRSPGSGATSAREPSGPRLAESLEATVRDWLDAWMLQDFEKYLSFYSESFRGGGDGRSAWLEDRRPALLDPEWIALAIDGLRVELVGAAEAETRFVLTYRNPVYADRSAKKVRWVRDAERWRISAEESLLLERLDRGVSVPLDESGAGPDGLQPARGDEPVRAERPPGRGPSRVTSASTTASTRDLLLSDGTTLRLEIIVWSETNPFVQIGGAFVEVGEKIAGWEVVEIQRDRARLIGPDGEERELRIR